MLSVGLFIQFQQQQRSSRFELVKKKELISIILSLATVAASISNLFVRSSIQKIPLIRKIIEVVNCN